MSNTLLQQFLDAGLFNFGDNDERLEDFKAAADDLAKDFVKSPQKIIPATLVALDPTVPDDEPVLEETETAIKQHWNSFRNKFPERQKGFLRPVLLDAISQAAEKDLDIASAVWMSGGNLLSQLPSNKERPLLESFLNPLGVKCEKNAENRWAPSQPEEFASPKFSLKVNQLQNVSIDAESIKAPLRQWHNHYLNSNFTNAIGDAIAENVNRALVSLSTASASLAEQLESPMKKFGKELGNGVAEWVNSSLRSVSSRSDLLWWKETLYSPRLLRSYRGLSPSELAIAMSSDLYCLTSTPSPQSAEFFLRETVQSVLPENPKITVGDLILAANQSTPLSKIIKPTTTPPKPHRVCLAQALNYARHAELIDAAFPAWLGLSHSVSLPVTEAAVWLFRDAQALYLTTPAEKA